MKIICLIWGILILLVPSSVVAQTEVLRVAPERIVFSTEYGDLVFALYPDIAPQHVAHLLNLTQLGAYDTTRFHRVESGFVIQLTTIHDRLIPLTPEQRQADKKVPGEFSTTVKHRKGSLSMARWDDPNSATSSFSILLNSAPHLDGQYTVFGHLESGGTVVNRILGVPRDDTKPHKRLTVLKARVVQDMDLYYAQNPKDPPSVMGRAIPQMVEDLSGTHVASLPLEFAGMFLAIVFLSLVGFLFYERLTKKILLSLLMLNALVGGFALLILLLPLGHEESWLAPIVFIGLLGLFKFMNRFESKQ